MVQALIYLSSKNIFHRDLKPANILIDGENPNEKPSVDDQVYIADFGISIQQDGTRTIA